MKREVDIDMPKFTMSKRKKPYETSSLIFTSKNPYSMCMANTKLDKLVKNYLVK